MTTLLRLDSSITGEKSVSRKLTGAIIGHLRSQGQIHVVERDLVAEPLPAFTAETLAGFFVEPKPQQAEHKREERLDRIVLAEFLAAEVVVIGAPMYNFSIPSQLKTWIDYVTVAGKSFRYTENGPEGLLGDKQVIVASSRGNIYSRDHTLARQDHQESYLQTVMSFFGISNLRFIRAEGVAARPDQATEIIEAALDEIRTLVPLPSGQTG